MATSKSGLTFEEEKMLVHLLEKQRASKKQTKDGPYDASEAALPTAVQGGSTSGSSDVKTAPEHEVEEEWILDSETLLMDSAAILEIADAELAVEEGNRVRPYYCDKAVYFPQNVKNFEECSKTLLTFPSLRSRHMSYEDFFMQSVYGSQKDVKELGGFARWTVKR